MLSKLEGFFKSKPDDSCLKMPTLNKGGVHMDAGGCFGPAKVTVTFPHISINDKKTSEKIAEEHSISIYL